MHLMVWRGQQRKRGPVDDLVLELPQDPASSTTTWDITCRVVVMAHSDSSACPATAVVHYASEVRLAFTTSVTCHACTGFGVQQEAEYSRVDDQ